MQWRRALLIFSLVVGLDQGSKWWAQANGVPTLLNTGVAGGIGQHLSLPVLLAILVCSLATMLWLFREWWRGHPILAGIFFGGVISNLVDRIMMGGVRDWLPVPGLGLQNNLADWAVVGSLGLIVLYTFRTPSKKKTPSKKVTDGE